MCYEVLQNAANSYKDEFEKIDNVTDIEIKGEREEIIKINLNASAIAKVWHK